MTGVQRWAPGRSVRCGGCGSAACHAAETLAAGAPTWSLTFQLTYTACAEAEGQRGLWVLMIACRLEGARPSPAVQRPRLRCEAIGEGAGSKGLPAGLLHQPTRPPARPPARPPHLRPAGQTRCHSPAGCRMHSSRSHIHSGTWAQRMSAPEHTVSCPVTSRRAPRLLPTPQSKAGRRLRPATPALPSHVATWRAQLALGVHFISSLTSLQPLRCTSPARLTCPAGRCGTRPFAAGMAAPWFPAPARQTCVRRPAARPG